MSKPEVNKEGRQTSTQDSKRANKLQQAIAPK
jgi:hypothetical protein